MSSELLLKLEKKIDQAIETIELMRIQIEELEEKNSMLTDENNTVIDKQEAWEKNLKLMLEKLDKVEESELSSPSTTKSLQETI